MKIGIISEGITDYWILKHIIEHYLKELDAYTIPLKPKLQNGKQSGFGSWQGVLEYISGEDKMIKEAVEEDCKFIVIQIDTDVSPQYGVEFDSQTKDIELLYKNAVAKLENTAHKEIDRNIIIYAVSIHTTECWLIPFVCSNNNKCSKLDNCLRTLNNEISSNNKTIIEKDKNGDASKAGYRYILDKKKKANEIKDCAKHNIGFQKFIEQLDNVRSEQ